MSAETTQPTREYPTIIHRVKAVFTDTVIIILFMYTLSDFFSLFENVPNGVRVLAFIFLFFLYEPLLVSLLGGTVGHKFNHIRVKREGDETKNISFPAAIIRFAIKSTLGWISFLTMGKDQKNLAIHDKAAKSVVVFEEK